jgi:hypothetical protein
MGTKIERNKSSRRIRRIDAKITIISKIIRYTTFGKLE